jgi:hypothetical protein
MYDVTVARKFAYITCCKSIKEEYLTIPEYVWNALKKNTKNGIRNKSL